MNLTRSVKYRKLKAIIIDEISMVGKRLLNFIHTRLQQLTGTKSDFGGISIIAVGDLYQLKSVRDEWIFREPETEKGPLSLACNLWKEHFLMYELTQIMRQKDDLYFSELLNHLGVN